MVCVPCFGCCPILLVLICLQVRWALGNASEDGAANFGLPMRIEPFRNSKDDDWGCVAARRCAQVVAGCVPAASQTSCMESRRWLPASWHDTTERLSVSNTAHAA